MKQTNPKFLLSFILLCGAGFPFALFAGPEMCGNGVVDVGTHTDGIPEDCDEGPFDASATCTNQENQGNGTCTFTFCGDGVVQLTTNGTGVLEQCEPPSTATCDNTCQEIVTTTTTTSTTTTTAAPTTTTTTAAPTTTTTTAAPTTTTTTAAPTTTTTTAAPTTTTTTAAPTTTTTTAAPTTTTTTAAPTTTTTTAVPTTTTTTQVSGQCPTATVIIGGCDSGVPDLLSDGSCISDVVTACDTRNHGIYTSCVRQAVRSMDLSRKQMHAIGVCAAKSDIGRNTTTPPTATTTTTAPTTTTTTQVLVQCPTATVIIDGCDSGVPNLSDGSCISDVVTACDTSNHGIYTSCVRQAVRSMDISRKQMHAIGVCAAKSSIGREG